MLSRSVFAFSVFLLGSPLAGAAEEAARPGSAGSDPFANAATLDRQSLLSAVTWRNPTLSAARSAWQAAAARPSVERALPDPMLSYGLAPLSIAGGSLRLGQQIEVSQELPLPSRRRLRGERAQAEAAGIAADFRQAMLELLARASTLYDDYYAVSRALAIYDQHRTLLGELQRVATARYAAGLTPQQDPIQAELESSRVLHRRIELAAERERIVGRLDLLLHLPADHPLPPPPAELPSPIPRALELDALTRSALARRPELASQSARVEAQRAALELAELARRPDLGVRGSYDSLWSEPGYRWMVGVSLNLPLRRERLAGQRTEARARLEQAEAELAASEDRIRSEVREAAIGVEEAQHLLEIYAARLLPAARDQVSASRAGFETGRSSFLALIDAERSLRDVELGREQAVADLHREQAELDRAVGRLPAGLPAELLEPGGPGAAPRSAEGRPNAANSEGGSR
jgi:cobalt-zinc-cadmium efflux system outer membrane protein